ncbi:ovalbumin-like [Bos indicus x Bos taurus]|uniref:Ovalbumin-like n=1 Tax=Bos indicus x Bos taurus TaxID=30522 RepID=A0A4W2GBV0_BOBOX|nr:ovalbumin-like [Bos indicus x Bos taurus]XP_027382014.1 ovalbumin-like [Bos indicus x Bos taurus]XP_027382015.1 ovalbumin-like [Bos indicus x Bos taurus]
MDSLSVANAQFCFDVFKEISCDHTIENVLLSPLSLLSALAVVLFGARGNSASQMEKVLHLNELTRTANSSNTRCEDTAVHSLIQAILSEISKSSHSQVHMASGLFAEKAHPFLPTYVDCIKQLYKLRPENLDFKNHLEEARIQINEQIENKTKGEVKELLFPSSLTSSDQLVLINAISFRGAWKYAFQKDQTMAMAFRLDESQSTSVQMMRLQGHLKLGSITEPPGQVLELPDVEDRLSMVIILPSKDASLGQVIREITPEKLNNWISSGNMKDTAVVLYLPQLRLKGFPEDLAPVLAALGMGDVFDRSRANLSGIIAGGGLGVSKIIHKAMLEVNESASEFTLTNQTIKVENPEIFKVDHPFLFFILHKETKMILFYGRVSNP